jgi:hypothetical protein
MADVPIPRLTVQSGKDWLMNNHKSGLDRSHALLAHQWAQSVMQRFGSKAYTTGVRLLCDALRDDVKLNQVGISKTEAEALQKALVNDVEDDGEGNHNESDDFNNNGELGQNKSISNQNQSHHSHSTTSKVPKQPLLRRLASNGVLAKLINATSQKQCENLIFKMLLLLPEEYVEKNDNCQNASNSQGNNSDASSQSISLPLSVRKAVLYALSEMERGIAYLKTLREIENARQISDPERRKQIETHLVSHLLTLVRLAHDGDRSIVDYRKLKFVFQTASNSGHVSSSSSTSSSSSSVSPAPSLTQASSYPWTHFANTPWSVNPNSSVSDSTIKSWIASAQPPPLYACVGGYERSLPEIDEMADEIDSVFQRTAALRVAAAGLGGK